jgi:hypothetical protein
MSAQWFCRIMGEEWGPMSALELRTVARRGRLTRDDVVRNGFNGDWVRAEIVHGLFDNVPPTIISRGEPLTVSGRPIARPATRSFQLARERYWLRHEGETAGPFSDRQIRRLAAMGRLKAEYFLSKDRNRWQRIADVEFFALAK